MIQIKIIKEENCFDVFISDEDGGFTAHEFTTKKDAENFAHRATDLFSEVEDVELIVSQSPPSGSGD